MMVINNKSNYSKMPVSSSSDLSTSAQFSFSFKLEGFKMDFFHFSLTSTHLQDMKNEKKGEVKNLGFF